MSKIVSIICRGCSTDKQVQVENDNIPDVIRNEWLCSKCDKKFEQLKAKKLAEAQAEQEKISNPSNCLSCQTKIKKGKYCSSCLKKSIGESIEKAREKSQELNNILENSVNNLEESNNQLKEALLDYLAKLEQNNKKGKLEDIETELKENEEKISRIKQQIEENNKKNSNIKNIFNTCAGCKKDISEEISYYLPGEELTRHWCTNCYPKSNNPSSSDPLPTSTPLSNPSSQNQNNQSNIKCYNCKKNFNYGDNTHYFPQNPDKKWCDACDPEIKICLDATQKIFQNQEVNINNLNISTENKEQLKALNKIKKGEQVNIDNLNIDQEAKEELKEIQKQISTNLPTNKPQ